jgi:lipopolysaccharide export system protein LptA
MPLPIYRLRRWLAAITVLFIAVIAGMYLYARMRERNVMKEIPNRIGVDIKQTANGFQFSKSDGKRTQFTVQASDVKQFKLDGSAELHNVSIVLYGRDSSRFDQIYGDDFSYDKSTGNVTGKGEVQIDLEANPAGQSAPDQAAPRELKNPIHLKTRDLVFNQNTGDAFTDARVDFTTPQASGWAVGVHYKSKSSTLTLESQVHVTFTGSDAGTLYATHGVITRDPHVVVLDHPRMVRESGIVQADEATFFLKPDNSVDHIVATGNVSAETREGSPEPTRARADQGEMQLTGKQNLLRTATLTGNVHVERTGTQPMRGDAGRAVLDFVGRNELTRVHATDAVHLAQQAPDKPLQATGANLSKESSQSTSQSTTQLQDYDITARVIDFYVADGKRLDHAETGGAGQITISPAENSSPQSNAESSGQRTIITAGRFEAKFVPAPDGSSRISSMHGAPSARIVNSAPGAPDRVSTSETLDATFLPEGGIESITQQGNVAYTDNQPANKRTQAWADLAVYTPSDRILVLTGSPRVSDGSMVTTANTVRINRETNDAVAIGDVKSTYSELKEQPNGALLASASPIHVTAATMTAHNSPSVALYKGNARLWQDASVIEAPSIRFDRDHRSLLAQGTASQPVTTVIVQAKLNPSDSAQASVEPGGEDAKKKSGLLKKGHQTDRKLARKDDDTSPITVTAPKLTYTDADRLAHYEGGVQAKGTSFTASAKVMDVYLLPRAQTSSGQLVATGKAMPPGPGQLDHLIARGNVVILQPDRKAEGQHLLYTASDDKFVLTGGPPSIFDAERGKITGDSLTFFRADDRVLVEGEASTPVVTQSKAAR